MVQKSGEEKPPFGCIKPLLNNGISTTGSSTGELIPDVFRLARITKEIKQKSFWASQIWKDHILK